MKFFFIQEFFSRILIPEMHVKMDLRIITKNHAADPEIAFLTKSISKPFGRATAMPPASELKLIFIRKLISARILTKY